ncbi:MAG: hypothetical protein IJJ16_05730 [Mogibacterium sp.]|nr:hypothetical protein [Mogibacterium sp.]
MSKRNRRKTLLSTLLIAAMMFMLAACGAKGGDAADTEEPEEGTEVTQDAEIVKSLDEIDTADMPDVPLQIESVTLYDDGTLRIVPTEDLLKNAETNNEVVDGAVFPFADSGEVKDFYLVRFGNGGYRTIICLMDDGSLSALSANELIQDHIFIVMDNLTGRDTYVDVKEVAGDDAFNVFGITEDNEEIELDFSLNF